MIRLAHERDAAAVVEVANSAYSMYIPRLGRKPLPMNEDYLALISQGIVHVVEENGVIAGLIVLTPKDDAMLLLNIAVRPDAQGRGLGRALLNFAEEKALTDGYDVMRLYTNEVMFENQAVYKHCGYTETDRKVEHGAHRVYMEKQLRP